MPRCFEQFPLRRIDATFEERDFLDSRRSGVIAEIAGSEDDRVRGAVARFEQNQFLRLASQSSEPRQQPTDRPTARAGRSKRRKDEEMSEHFDTDPVMCGHDI